MVSHEAGSSGLFRALRARNYRCYFLGQLVSMCGTWAQTVAMSWLVLELTGEAAQVGGVVAVQYALLLCVSPLAGVYIDRIDRRHAVVAGELFLGIQATVLAAIVLTDQTQVWMLYGFAAAEGVGIAFEQPARQSLIAELVPPHDLPNAVALNGALFTLARIVGPAVAGVLIVTVGVGLCFSLNALSFVGIVIAVLAMRPAEMYHRASVQAASGQLREGIRYVRADHLVRLLLAEPLVTGVYVGLSATVYPLLARSTFDGDAATYGLMGTLAGVGAAAAALGVARHTEVTIRRLMYFVLGTAASLLASALAPTLAIELLVLPFVGAFTLGQSVSAVTKLQLVTRPRLRGRVIALYSMAAAAGATVGGAALGAVAQSWGPRPAIGIGAALAFVLASALAVHRHRSEPGRAAVARPQAAR